MIYLTVTNWILNPKTLPFCAECSFIYTNLLFSSITCLMTSTLLSAPHPLKYVVYLVCQMFYMSYKVYDNVQEYY